MFQVIVPKMNTAGVIAKDWPQACVVPRWAIEGRVWVVYEPPAARRFVK